MGRLRAVYCPSGRAREYAPLACNLYRGCDHGCSYCYAPRVLRMAAEAFRSSMPRKDILSKLLLDCQDLYEADNKDTILLCFTCDPYCQAEMQHGITRKAVEMLLAYRQPITILTKGGNRSLRDFHILRRDPSLVTYATSLTLADEGQRQAIEPGAAPAEERIAALAAAKGEGFATWVSCEPVIDPVQTLALIRRAAPYTDLFRVGKLNHDPLAERINWPVFVEDVVALLGDLGKPYVLKADLLPYCGGGA